MSINNKLHTHSNRVSIAAINNVQQKNDRYIEGRDGTVDNKTQLRPQASTTSNTGSVVQNFTVADVKRPMQNVYQILLIFAAWCLSVRLSCSCILLKWVNISSNILPSHSPTILVVLPYETLWWNAGEYPLNGDVECRWNIKNRDLRPISRFISERNKIGSVTMERLRNSYAIYRMVPFLTTLKLNHPWPRFQGHATIRCWISQKRYKIETSLQ